MLGPHATDALDLSAVGGAARGARHSTRARVRRVVVWGAQCACSRHRGRARSSWQRGRRARCHAAKVSCRAAHARRYPATTRTRHGAPASFTD